MDTNQETSVIKIISPDLEIISTPLRQAIIRQANSGLLDSAIADTVTENQAPILSIIPDAPLWIKRLWDDSIARTFLFIPFVGQIVALGWFFTEEDNRWAYKDGPTIHTKLPNGFPVKYDFAYKYYRYKLDTIDITPSIPGGEHPETPMPPTIHFEIVQRHRSRRSRRIVEISMQFSKGNRDISQLGDPELEKLYRRFMPNLRDNHHCEIVFKTTHNNIPTIIFKDSYQHVYLVFNDDENGFITANHKPGTPPELSVENYLRFLQIPFNLIPYARVQR